VYYSHNRICKFIEILLDIVNIHVYTSGNVYDYRLFFYRHRSRKSDKICHLSNSQKGHRIAAPAARTATVNRSPELMIAARQQKPRTVKQHHKRGKSERREDARQAQGYHEMTLPTLEILEPSLISEMAHRAVSRPLEILYPHTDPRGQQARTLTATEPSRASCRPGAVTTRSHRHHAESEA
jgi:hypothetical protein